MAERLEDAGPLNDERLLFIKFKHWEYEDELRQVVALADTLREGRLHFKRFGHGLWLREVILGDQCALNLEAVRALVTANHPGAVTYRARLAGKFFKVVPDGATVP